MCITCAYILVVTDIIYNNTRNTQKKLVVTQTCKEKCNANNNVFNERTMERIGTALI